MLDHLENNTTGYAKSNQHSVIRNKSSQRNLGSEHTLVSKRSRSTIKPPLDHNADKSFYQFGSMGPSKLLQDSGSKKSIPRMGDYHQNLTTLHKYVRPGPGQYDPPSYLDNYKKANFNISGLRTNP